MGKYFSVKKKIEVAASKQHAAFTSGDVVCDWQPIQVPKGGGCLKSLTILFRPKGDAAPTTNKPAVDIVFSTTNTVSLGIVNSNIAHAPSNDFIGITEIEADQYASGAWQSTSIASLGTDAQGSKLPLVLTGGANGITVGFETLYVGIVAREAIDFTSLNAIAEAGSAGAASTQVIAMDGTGMDVREHFAAGDVVHIGTSVGTPAADSLIGTIESVGIQELTLESTSATDLVDGDILYNLHPITLILGFER